MKNQYQTKKNFIVVFEYRKYYRCWYRHAKNVYKEFNDTNLGDYHNLYDQSDTLLLSDIFKNLRDNCIKIYKLDPAYSYQR